MSTYVVLVNERPESRAALNWALQTVEAFPGTADIKLHVVLGPRPTFRAALATCHRR